MRESRIERRFVREVEKRKGFCPKWTSPGTDGVTDRLVFLPGGWFDIVELKKPGKKLRPIQRVIHNLLHSLGQKPKTLDSIEAVEEYFKNVDKERNGI